MTRAPGRPEYPHAPRLDLVEHLHGFDVADPYRWLEDPDDPATKQWSAAEDELLAAHRAQWAGQDGLRTRIGELLGAGVVSAPIWRGERQFFMRRTAEQEHAVLLTVDPDGTERLLLDPMELDASRARPRWTRGSPPRRATCWPTRSPRGGPRSPSSASSTS